MIPLTFPSNEAFQRLKQIKSRRIELGGEIEQQVKEIIEQVKEKGDEALVNYTRKFDCPGYTPGDISVRDNEIDEARKKVDDDFKDILKRAIENITKFHENQKQKSWFQTSDDGTILGQIVRPVKSAGLYIPGGKGGETPLISSVLMNAIPAKIAGVEDLAMVSPPKRDGSLNPYLLVAAESVGIKRIHKLGSAWAIAALAFGTESVLPVDVIVGPGNIYVALAKSLVSGRVGIDMIAGPSEILVIADSSASPEEVAADLLSQAEHDPMASSIFITTDEDLAGKVSAEVERQLDLLPRNEIARESWDNFGGIFVVKDLDMAAELANDLAPEHLEILIDAPFDLLAKIKNAGAIFLGRHSPEAVGDYFAGPNHVLPTSGTARFASALSVDDFVKKSSVIYYSGEAFMRDASAIIKLAELEGLEAHARSIKVRLKDQSKIR